MKQILKYSGLFIMALILSISCSGEEEAAEGFPADEKDKFATAVCTWCGDYSLETAGSTYTTIGQTLRICGISDKWDGGCPIRTELGDSSVWKKQSPSNCSCD